MVIGSGQVLGQLLRGSHTGNDNGDIRVCQNVAQSQGGILNGTACQRLHVDKADVLFLTGPDQRLTLGFHNVIGEHDGLHPVQGQCLFKDLGRMGGQADVADLPGGTGLQQGFQCAAGGDDLLQLGHAGVVYLIQVDIVGAEVAEACFNVCLHCFAGACHALCCKNELVTPSVDCAADVFFADGVAACRVDIVYSAFNKGVDKRLCLFRIDALNGDAAETDAGNLKPGFAECYILHECTLRICINYCFLKLNSLRRIPCGCGFRLRYYKLFFAKKQINKSVLKKRTDGPRTLMPQCVNFATLLRIRLTLCPAGV